MEEQSKRYLQNLLEGLLFSSPRPMSLEEMEKVTGQKGEDILQRLEDLKREYEEREGALFIRRVHGKWQMAVRPQYGEILRECLHSSNSKVISRSALETLALVSLYQPVTKAEIDLRRGVDSAQALRTLLGMGLVTVCGRSDTPGRPFLYRVTGKFFEVFGLEGEEELEKLKRLFTERSHGAIE